MYGISTKTKWQDGRVVKGVVIERKIAAGCVISINGIPCCCENNLIILLLFSFVVQNVHLVQ